MEKNKTQELFCSEEDKKMEIWTKENRIKELLLQVESRKNAVVNIA